LITPAEGPILYFDGVCNLCNRAVQFVLKHDKKKVFSFASLQSQHGRKAMAAIGFANGASPDSVILYHKERYFQRSAAALKTFELLGFPWSLLKACYVIPAFMRNGLYDQIAKHRYSWFGRKDECMIPSPELNARFLS
jgi:predicted DCC family thiol-disulfide oxidoreductase YuxK